MYKFHKHDYHVHVLIKKMSPVMKDNIAKNITGYVILILVNVMYLGSFHEILGSSLE